MKPSLRRLPLYAVALLLLLSACRKNKECDVPIGNASFTIDLRSADAAHLTDIGGYVYASGGNKGVCVLHVSANEYNAFERTCPHDHDVAVEVDSESGGLVLQCPKCGSRFLATDGMPLEGSVTSCYLYQYSASLDGYYLHVW